MFFPSNPRNIEPKFFFSANIKARKSDQNCYGGVFPHTLRHRIYNKAENEKYFGKSSVKWDSK